MALADQEYTVNLFNLTNIKISYKIKCIFYWNKIIVV